jgi:hypothetical protein
MSKHRITRRQAKSIHAHGQRPAVHRAGCWNKPRTVPPPRIVDDAIMLPDRVIRIKTEIPHAMSHLCRQISPLPECEGCTAEKDHEYINRMKNSNG